MKTRILARISKLEDMQSKGDGHSYKVEVIAADKQIYYRDGIEITWEQWKAAADKVPGKITIGGK